ncbi:MAG: pur operon repressor [Firmicutes bacterium]|nr:pur operon repressor [Bacillota bacterium]
MAKHRRGHRVAATTTLLHQNPGRLITLGELAERTGGSRSSLSEDLAVIREVLHEHDLGSVVTLPGVAGGVRFVPIPGPQAARQVIAELCRELSDPRRLIAGGYLYMTDVVFSPQWSWRLGQVFAFLFTQPRPGGGAPPAAEADCVATVETKGIPLALMTARCLGLPLVVARRGLRVTEGSSVTINFVSGSTGRIQTMSLPRRALAPGARVLVVDDFMKAGSTARGLEDLLGEFGARVLAIGILTVTALPAEKLVGRYQALTILQGVDERRRVVSVVPGPGLDGL